MTTLHGLVTISEFLQALTSLTSIFVNLMNVLHYIVSLTLLLGPLLMKLEILFLISFIVTLLLDNELFVYSTVLL